MTHIRPYRPADLADLYEICVKTGNSGQDATGRFESDDLLPDIYVGPYLAFEPELAFVVDVGGRAAGYILATANTRAFVERYRTEWLPDFAAKYPLVNPPRTLDDRVVKIGHTPESMLGADVDEFPAHLHIDLLPEVQGNGIGRTLIRTLQTALLDRGVPGVQLGVGERNTNARGFYRHLGFHPLPSTPDNDLVLGIATDASI
jgi:ribosomal protein S18 acetylase RimI-like enzyme